MEKSLKKYLTGEDDDNTIAKQASRIDEIDILKGIAIILMVAGHSGAPFTHFIYLFHMAVFFIASGYFFKDSSSDNLKNVWISIKKKIKGLWIPFFVCNTIFVILHNFFVVINVYTNNPAITDFVTGKYIGTTEFYSPTEILMRVFKGLVFSTNEQLLGAGWFLKILFIISVLYVVFDYCAKKLKVSPILLQSIIAIIFLIVGWFCSINGIYFHGLEQVASCYCLYYIGCFLKHKINSHYDNWKIAILSTVILLIFNKYISISLASNNYANPAFMFLCSLSGWYILYFFANIICRFKVLKLLFETLGKNTLPIVLGHFLAMKLVNLLVVSVHTLPLFCVSAFPNLYGSYGWWGLYIVVGCGMPTVCNIIKNKLLKWAFLKSRD